MGEGLHDLCQQRRERAGEPEDMGHTASADDGARLAVDGRISLRTELRGRRIEVWRLPPPHLPLASVGGAHQGGCVEFGGRDECPW